MINQGYWTENGCWIPPVPLTYSIGEGQWIVMPPSNLDETISLYLEIKEEGEENFHIYVDDIVDSFTKITVSCDNSTVTCIRWGVNYL